MQERTPLNHDPLGNGHPDTGHPTTTGAGPREFADAVPRGNILRNADPVVSPVATPPVSGGAASGVGATTTATSTASNGTLEGGSRLDSSSRRTLDEPDAGTPAGRYGARTVSGVPSRRFSLGATFLGWCVASFFVFGLTAILLGALGGTAANDATTGDGLTYGDLLALGAMAFVAWLVIQFVSYLVGGYAAGRIAHWNGAKHGAIVPVWAILAGLLMLGAGVWLGTAYADALGAVPPRIDAADLTTYGILGILATLATMFLGAILGGILGARHDQSYEGDTPAARPAGRTRRGRPL